MKVPDLHGTQKGTHRGERIARGALLLAPDRVQVTSIRYMTNGLKVYCPQPSSITCRHVYHKLIHANEHRTDAISPDSISQHKRAECACKSDGLLSCGPKPPLLQGPACPQLQPLVAAACFNHFQTLDARLLGAFLQSSRFRGLNAKPLRESARHCLGGFECFRVHSLGLWASSQAWRNAKLCLKDVDCNGRATAGMS